MTFGWGYKVSNKNKKKEKQVGSRSPDQNILLLYTGALHND